MNEKELEIANEMEESLNDAYRDTSCPCIGDKKLDTYREDFENGLRQCLICGKSV